MCFVVGQKGNLGYRGPRGPSGPVGTKLLNIHCFSPSGLNFIQPRLPC